MRDQGIAEQISELARKLTLLGARVEAHHQPSEPAAAPHPDEATQALLTRLAYLVELLRDRVDEGRRWTPFGMPTAPSGDSDPTHPSASRVGSTAQATNGHTDRTDRRTAGQRPLPTPKRSHGVHFASSDDHTVGAILDMFDLARASGRAVIVVAVPAHRQSVEDELHRRCIALDGDVCQLLDADTILRSLLVDGRPDRDRFRSIVGGLMSDVWARNPGGVSVYGEMVGLLWARGLPLAAIRLEALWNELQLELPFDLLCGYTVDGRLDSADLDPVRHAHSYVA